MTERTEMIHSITGTAMSVPAELVAAFEKAGHKCAAQVEPAEEGSTTGEPAEEGKNKKNK